VTKSWISGLKPYQIVNILLASVILLIFIYSALFSPSKSNYPLHSAHTAITGAPSESTGLSRGFSSVIRFHFDQAREYNPHSVKLFLFFVIQLVMRIFFAMNYSSLIETIGIKESVIIDGLISGVLFLLFFEPFWREMISQ
jgi:hypothetical protein